MSTIAMYNNNKTSTNLRMLNTQQLPPKQKLKNYTLFKTIYR